MKRAYRYPAQELRKTAYMQTVAASWISTIILTNREISLSRRSRRWMGDLRIATKIKMMPILACIPKYSLESRQMKP